MLVDVTRYHLEMTSPDQLVPGKFPPRPIEVERISTASAAEAGSTFERVGAAYHWRGREGWSRRQWESHLSRPDIRSWLLRTDGEIAGMVELEALPDGDVEMITFGLLPELVGRGFGGYALTLATRLAWQFEHPGGKPTKRVWLHTNSLDHPHAKPNYERRGFRVFRTGRFQREMPG